uniref:Uncharacterized protein n=1 Tax=viral metagenome TaxID=1070528 RepID=A0A2V0RAR4_9ZZZZ
MLIKTNLIGAFGGTANTSLWRTFEWSFDFAGGTFGGFACVPSIGEGGFTLGSGVKWNWSPTGTNILPAVGTSGLVGALALNSASLGFSAVERQWFVDRYNALINVLAWRTV